LERELAERDKLATLGQMAATVAHNIKNPLSSIKTIVQLIQEDDEVAVKYARDLSLINSEIDRLSNSVGQLLKFAKPTAPTAADIDLTDVLRKILSIFRAETEHRGIQLQFEQESTPLTVRGSEEVLCEVFQNLIVNAIEVSPERSRIVIGTGVLDGNQGKRIVFRIEDQGPGIAPEVRPHIFKPFFTTKQKGTGLGLAVVQRRVLDLGGEIDCISPLSQNGGTRFELTLPLKN
jgi:signal transduction histidine kinase